MDYFLTLQNHQGQVTKFFDYWDRLKALPHGSLTVGDLVSILRGTAAAYKKWGRETFKDGFRLRLQKSLPDVLAHVATDLSRIGPSHIEGLNYSFASIGIQPDHRFWHDVSKAASDRLHRANNIELSNIIYAHAGLSKQPLPVLFDPWAESVEDHIDQFRMRDAAVTMWSLAVLDSVQTNPKFRTIAEMCFDRALEIGAPPSDRQNSPLLRQIRDTALWFGFDTDAFPAPLKPGNSGSSLEQEVRGFLSRGGAKILPRAQTHKSVLDNRCDWAISACGRTVNVEADGWTHLIRNANGGFGYNGHTLFQTALALRVDPQRPIVRVPNIAINRAKAATGTVPSRSMCNCFMQAAANCNETGRAGGYFMTYNEQANAMGLQRLVA
ncbi:MAG: hypothetical protein EBQ96_03485 [Proteobacteria bacterium]|nr:hypothetical protein [Pseudomonadota bacterium]